MSCFSVTDPFLTIFYYVEKRNGILRKNRRSLRNLTYPYMGEGGVVENGLNLPYVINEWPLILYGESEACFHAQGSFVSSLESCREHRTVCQRELFFSLKLYFSNGCSNLICKLLELSLMKDN